MGGHNEEKCGTGFKTRQWINLECCGLVCAVITHLLILFAVYTINVAVIFPWTGSTIYSFINSSIMNTLLCLGLISHVKAMTTDPGAVPLGAQPLDEGESEGGQGHRKCRRCEVFKPPRAHHCSICNRCIVKMDHHCPWVNNCVGIGNHKFFLLFLFYICSASVYAIILIVFRFISCVPVEMARNEGTLTETANDPNRCLSMSPGQTVCVVILIIEAFLFGLFTCCMGCDQAQGIMTSQTAIDRLKGDIVEKRSVLDNLREVFGGNGHFTIDWLLPVDQQFRDWSDLTGYTVQDSDGRDTGNSDGNSNGNSDYGGSSNNGEMERLV